MAQFKVGDRVVLNGCPFDEQIGEEAIRYAKLVRVPMVITRVKKVSEPGTSGQWVKTDKMAGDWTDAAWFKHRVVPTTCRKQPQPPRREEE